MRNFVTYIKSYGQLGFDEKDFNDVDCLILAQFSYLKMDNIVPYVGKGDAYILIKDIQNHPCKDELFADERYAKANKELFDAMANSNRFGNIKLKHHINLINKHIELQFSAVCCELPTGVTCVIYRGTDETIIGWKEDFNMAFTTPIKAQITAVDYLNYVAERISGNFVVGGHSKGGNLAVYAAMKCPKATCDRISAIYSFDGPGFTKEALSDGSFDNIKSRIRKFVPRSSIVGMLLQNQEDYRVVECASFGILQHDPFNWIVEDDNFILRDDIRDIYQIQSDSIDKWTENTSAEEMKVLVEEFYNVVSELGIENLNDIKGNHTEIIKQFASAVDNIDDKHKEVLKLVFKNLIDAFIETIKGQPGISILSELDKIGKRNI